MVDDRFVDRRLASTPFDTPPFVSSADKSLVVSAADLANEFRLLLSDA
jgi:hypothetical protein